MFFVFLDIIILLEFVHEAEQTRKYRFTLKIMQRHTASHMIEANAKLEICAT